MLSSLASYLLGGGAAAAADTRSPPEAHVPPSGACLDAIDADDDWVLVESNCADSTFVDLRLTVSAVTTAVPTTGALPPTTSGAVGMGTGAGAGARERRQCSRVELRPPTPVAGDGVREDEGVGSRSDEGLSSEGGAGTLTPAGLRSRSSSSTSLPCLHVDESWYVTPPPCFTSTGPVHMETSPLEDLLIEHPSMSVYRQHPMAAPLPPVPAQVPAPTPATAAEEAAPRPRAGSLPPAAPRVLAPARVPAPGAPPAVPVAGDRGVLRLQEQQALHIKTAQKVQQRRATQAMKRGPLERHNKARECNGRNKVLRRSDRMLQHSGANNNRKC